MTIRRGEMFHIETRSQFMKRLDVDYFEVFAAWDESDQAKFLKIVDEVSSDWDDLDPKRLADIPEVQFQEFIDAISVNQTIMDVLEARDREYVHLYDGMVHTIVELHPEDAYG